MRPRVLSASMLALVAVLCTSSASSANVQVGSSAWQWGNPLPQGNTIVTADFAGSAGYAAGGFGTLLKTTDSGRTWSGLRVGTFQALTVVQALTSETVFAGGGCVVRRSDDGGKSFRRIAFTNVESACKEQLTDLSFVNAQTGWILETDGTVVQTKDGGTEFIQRTALPGSRAAGGQATPKAIAFVSPVAGFAALADGKLYMTSDEGVSWKLVADTGKQALADIEFVDAQHGFAVGAGQLLIRTDDGGATWSPHALRAGGRDLDEIDCATPLLCVVTTAKGDQLVRTADAGATSSLVSASTDPLYAAAFASDTVVVAAGASGATVVSDDAGATFGAIGGRLSGKYLGITAGGQPGTAYAPGDNGALAVTTNGGATWVRGNVATSEDVRDVSFPTAQAGYALDTAGGLFRTQSGGQAWSALDAGAGTPPEAIYAPAPDTVLTIGPRGMRRSTDGGESFTRVTGAVAKRVFTAVDRAAGAVFANGRTNVFRSLDGGAGWTRVNRPGRRRGFAGLSVEQVDFVDAKRGFVLDTHGAVWKTTNAGRSYTRLEGVGTNDIHGIAFSSTSAGYLVVSRFGDATDAAGYLLRTTDGGATWRPQFVVNTAIGARGIATSGGPDYLLAGSSDMLSTTTGGDAGEASSLAISTARNKLKRSRRIKVSGKLTPASGFERVTVSHRNGGFWRHTTVRAAANGSFSTSWRVGRGANRFVAQWAGDFKSFGAGSKVLTVKVRRAGHK
jgi:photosystem II stability/assembly factor-like uncharacterized protein